MGNVGHMTHHLAHAPDPDLERALSWFLSFLDPADWSRRKESIEDHLDSVLTTHPSRTAAPAPTPVSVPADRIGWYLYLVETLLADPYRYEPIQGARVVPIFKRLGADLDSFLRIRGVENRVTKLLTSEGDSPDSGLFELTTALLWVRNGWPHVEIIPRSPAARTPDIRASSAHDEWFIECKRFDRSSGYSLHERQHWLRIWKVLADYLTDRRYLVVFDITIHVELDTLPDTFLLDYVKDYNLGAISSCVHLIDDANVTINVWPVDFSRVSQHLAKWSVKCPSDQLNELIAGYRDPNRGFSCVVEGRGGRINTGRGSNRFIHSIRFAAGSFWHCDAKRAIERKARDIRNRLADAVKQLPDKGKGVVHFGLETLDGWRVEAERYARIANTVYNFDARGKNLQWIYCHLFQPYSPPDADWVFDETIYHFTNRQFAHDEPLHDRAMIVPWEGGLEAGVHWLRDAP